MKKFYFSLFVVCLFTKAYTQQISFDYNEYNYGTIGNGTDGKCAFPFKNTGNRSLILSNVKSSCGCAIPNWPKGEIRPGATDVIYVTYDTKRVGPFSKSITVNSNASNPEIILRIKGEVIQGATTSNSTNNNQTKTSATNSSNQLVEYAPNENINIGKQTIIPTMSEYKTFAGYCYEGKFDLVKKYVDSGKSINPPTGAAFSALYIAIMQDQYDISNFLLQKGANVNYINEDSSTPLMATVMFQKIVNPVGFIKLLLNYNAEVNVINTTEGNISIIDIAATKKNPEILKLLINKGAKTTNQFSVSLDNNNCNYSSLTWLLASFCNLEIVKLYVDKGANVNSTVSLNGTTASALDFVNEMVKERGSCYTTISDYLKLKGAKNLYKESTGTRWLSINDLMGAIGISSDGNTQDESTIATKNQKIISDCKVKGKPVLLKTETERVYYNVTLTCGEKAKVYQKKNDTKNWFIEPSTTESIAGAFMAFPLWMSDHPYSYNELVDYLENKCVESKK